MASYSGLWDSVFSDGPHSLLINKASLRKRMSILFRQEGAQIPRELIDKLLGAAAGEAAEVTKVRRQAVVGTDGGVIPIETITKLDRVTATADVTDLKTILNEIRKPSPYATEKSGNSTGTNNSLLGY